MIKLSVNSDLRPYLPKLSSSHKKVIKAFPHLAHKVVNAAVFLLHVFRCVACGSLVLDEKYLLRKTCDSECLRKTQGAHFLGKKRPEHSAKMKVIIKSMVDAGKLWTAEHRRNNKQHLRHLNATLDREAQGEKLRAIETQRNRFARLAAGKLVPSFADHRLFKKSKLRKLTPTEVAKASAATIRRWNVEFNSIKSTVAMERNPDMGATQFYRRITMTGLKFHRGSTQVTVRSSLEYSFIKWLERKELPWRYEWVRISLPDGHRHVPDFKVWIGDAVWVVELKGVYFSRTGSPISFTKEKVTAAWCRRREYAYTVLGTAQVGKAGKKIRSKTWTDLTALSDRKLVSYLKRTIPGAKNASN